MKLDPMQLRRWPLALVVILATASAVSIPAAAQASDAKVWENYDFIPGSKVIFFTDFSEDKVGNFARGLKFKSGQADVVERDGVKVLRTTGRSEFLIPVGKKLPERFTLEIDVVSPAEQIAGYDIVAIEGGPELERGDASAELNWHPEGVTIIGGGRDGEIKVPEAVAAAAAGNVVHIRMLMDGPYLKFFSNERRIYNIPEFPFRRDSVIRVSFRGGDESNQVAYLTSIRVAESETDVLYDALTAKGRWATQGILFETGKSDLKPESRPVLKEIAETMKKYADLKILIEGHTDNVGAPASNLTLSDARAAAVKAALVSQFGIAADRMTTKGFGDTKPSVSNTTPAGRAQNRRVEIVRQ
jgi:outer membrane protein OmpA-like peptidoglycan-associated protein